MNDWVERLKTPERGATYVAVLDYSIPDPVTNPTEAAAGQDRQGTLQGRRTLFQIYKLKSNQVWQPANDLENIRLEVGITKINATYGTVQIDYTIVMELNVQELFHWPTFEAFQFRGLVFRNPWIFTEAGVEGEAETLMASLPQSEFRLSAQLLSAAG